jgi:hypothetical protein|tara:strand:+ start:22610 stop:24508 length:1899 start_codon:yes stop_codon:yes gene_type:complete
MSKISKFLKLDKNLLLEYIYDSGNLINEPYDILVNSRSSSNSYLSSESSGVSNSQENSLFLIDPVSRKLGKIDTDNYSFLQVKNYSQAGPIKHDKIRLHLPINWTFGEYIGLYLNVYTFDRQNQTKYDISNFYFDITDLDQQNLMDFTSPPLLYSEKLWGKNITIDIPSVDSISNQLTNNLPTENSINANLTDGSGLSLSSPVFIEVSFLTKKQVINGSTTYLSKSPIVSSVPQTPEFERLGLMIEPSNNGDFFEIYGTYNSNIGEFNKFINDSTQQGNRYYVQYDITIFEQNIRGKTTTIILTDNFNESVEYRPIIKYSTTTAVIDVEMRMIDAIDDSYIVRKASYGMLQDEVSKYSLRLSKINLKNAFKPKVYNIKNAINPSLVGKSNSMGMVDEFVSSGGVGNVNFDGSDVSVSSSGNNNGNNNGSDNGSGNIQTIKIPFPVLVEKFNVIGKSDNTIFDNKTFFSNGRIQIVLYPFDNIVKFVLASGESNAPDYMDLTIYSDLSFVIRNDFDSVTFPLYSETDEIQLDIGQIVFKLDKNKYNRIKSIYDSGINVFYITGTNQDVTSVVYNGLFKIFETRDNISSLNDELASGLDPSILDDPNLAGGQETAVVTRRTITEQTNPTPRNNS